MAALPGFVGGALKAKLENVSRTDLKARAQRISRARRTASGASLRAATR